MGRKMVEVKSLHGLTIEDLNFIANELNSDYSRIVIQAVIMRYNDVPTQVIADTLGKCVATIVSYINSWNEKGIIAITDNRGDNIPVFFTDEIMDDIRDAIINKSPSAFGFEHSRWNSKLISRYIEETYGRKYSKSWICFLLKTLGFSYKRGVFKPTLGDVNLKESFKKNDTASGYY